MPCPLKVGAATSSGVVKKPGDLAAYPEEEVDKGLELLLGLLALPRSDLESDFDPATLTEEDMCLLLAAMVKDYVQMKVGELEQETEDFR